MISNEILCLVEKNGRFKIQDWLSTCDEQLTTNNAISFCKFTYKSPNKNHYYNIPRRKDNRFLYLMFSILVLTFHTFHVHCDTNSADLVYVEICMLRIH